jgi:hypothetical protein
MWAPLNPLARKAGIVEDQAAPRAYLQAVLGNNFDGARVDAFLAASPRMVAFFEGHTALQFEAGNRICDTYGTLPGAGTGGRSVIAAPYDARRLGDLVARLRLADFRLLDTQFVTRHLSQFGAIEVPRADYKLLLQDALDLDCRFPVDPGAEALTQEFTRMAKPLS